MKYKCSFFSTRLILQRKWNAVLSSCIPAFVFARTLGNAVKFRSQDKALNKVPPPISWSVSGPITNNGDSVSTAKTVQLNLTLHQLSSLCGSTAFNQNRGTQILPRSRHWQHWPCQLHSGTASQPQLREIELELFIRTEMEVANEHPLV